MIDDLLKLIEDLDFVPRDYNDCVKLSHLFQLYGVVAFPDDIAEFFGVVMPDDFVFADSSRNFLSPYLPYVL